MKQNNKFKIELFDIIITLIVLVVTFISLKVYFTRPTPVDDFNINRTVCGYVLYGINPMNIVYQEPIISSFSRIQYQFGNTPYGLLLGNIFYFGFLPYDIGIKAFLIETILLMILTIFVAVRFFKKNYDSYISQKAIYYFILFTIVSVNIVGPTRIHNAGALMCMFLTIAILLSADHKVVSGICIAFAMIKPQVAIPICIAFLLYKNIIPLIVGATIDIIASLICAFLLNENVISLFIQSLGMNQHLDANPYYGFFSFLSPFDPRKTLHFSMIFGILLVILFCFLIKKEYSILEKYSMPALISGFWSYSYSSDFYILIIPTVEFMILFYEFFREYRINKNLLSKNCITQSTISTTKKYIILSFTALSALFIHFQWTEKSFIRNILCQKQYLSHLGFNYFEYIIVANTIVYTFVIIIMFIFTYLLNKYPFQKLEE